MENCLERIWNLVSEDAGLGSIILSHQPDKLSEPWSINRDPCDCTDDTVDGAFPYHWLAWCLWH